MACDTKPVTPASLCRSDELPELAHIGTRQGLVVTDDIGRLMVVPPTRLLPQFDTAAEEEIEVVAVAVQQELFDDDSMLLEHFGDIDLRTLLTPHVPPALSCNFRRDVMGDGNLDRLRLKAVIEQPFVWHGETYSALSEWSLAALSEAWSSASTAEQTRWRIMVGDLKKAYCALREFERGNLVCDAITYAKMACGGASFSAVRRAARQHAVAVHRGNHYIDEWCRSLVVA